MDYSTQLTMLASASTGDEGLMDVLGIDWMLLGLQMAAFLVLVWILGKFVYPIFLRIVDERQAKIEASVKAAEEAEQKATAANDEVANLLKQARKEAREIVATAKDEATAMVEQSDAKAKARAEKIVADAQDNIDKQVLAARKSLQEDTLELVALATEKVVGDAASKSVDDAVISAAIKEAGR